MNLITVIFLQLSLIIVNLSCDLSESLFNKTILYAANLTGSWDYNINVLNNTINKAKLSRLEAVLLLESLGIELVD